MEGEVSLPIRLLGMLAYGGIRSTTELAQRLGVSTTLVGMMAEDLTRRGYLKTLRGGDCGSGCASCGLVSQCKLPITDDRLPLLTLTEKGKLVASA